MDDGNDDVTGWEAFNWPSWGREPTDGDGEPVAPLASDGAAADAGAMRGQWISAGGVLRWEEEESGAEEPERLDLRAEARSSWAGDELELPLAAPPRQRIRALRAWLARQRLRSDAAQGDLLLERRRLEAAGAAPRADETDPLALALAQHVAASAEYEVLLEALAEQQRHSGPAQVLVELYLWLMERIAELAAAPEAPAHFAPGVPLAQVERPAQAEPVAPLGRAGWEGRAGALLATCRRLERLSTPEPED